MALDSVEKQSYESFILAAGFGNNMASGEELVLGSCSVSALKSDATDATTIVLTVATLAVSSDGQYLQVRVKAGVEVDSPYKITFKGVTDLGNQWEKDIELSIVEQ